MSQARRIGTIGATIAIAIGGAGFAGCGDDDNEGAAEEAGQAVDDASQDVEDAAGEAGEDITNAADDVDEEVGDEDESEKGGKGQD